MNQRGFTGLFIIGIIALIAIASIGSYFAWEQSITPTAQIPKISSSSETPPVTTTATSTTSTDTQGWKTYQNKKYGFELKYPPTLVASVDADTGELSLIPQNQGIEGGGISVSVDANPKQFSMTDYYTGNPGADLGASVSTTSVAGRVGFIFEPRNTMSCDVVVIVQRSDGSFVNIDDYGCGFQGNGIFDAVVRSLKLQN